MKNFHLPLPDEAYDRLKAAAERSNVPATALAREAIQYWLRQDARRVRHAAIATWAAEEAGTRTRSGIRPRSSGCGTSSFRSKSQVKRGDVYWSDLVPRSAQTRPEVAPLSSFLMMVLTRRHLAVDYCRSDLDIQLAGETWLNSG